MNTAKLIGLLLISFIATGYTIYNFRSRRPARVVAVPAPGSPTLPSRTISEPPPEPIAPVKDENAPRTVVPPNMWKRNPFLTIEEINRLNQPQTPTMVASAPVQKTVEPQALPTYAVTGILSGSRGYSAIVDDRVVRQGDRLGEETVKEIKDDGVILEGPKQTRELPLRRMEDTQAAAPKKETKK